MFTSWMRWGETCYFLEDFDPELRVAGQADGASLVILLGIRLEKHLTRLRASAPTPRKVAAMLIANKLAQAR